MSNSCPKNTLTIIPRCSNYMQKSILYQLLPLISIVLATSQVLSAQNMEKILQSDTTKFNYGGTDLLDIDLQLGGSNDKTGKVVPMSDKNTTPTKINAPANTGLVPNSLDKNTTTKVTPDSRPPAGNTLPIAQTRPVVPGQTPPPAYVPATVENQIPRHKLISPPVIKPVRGEDIYKTRLAAIPSLIPLDYNELVKGFIDMYLTDKRDQVSRMLSRTDDYFDTFESILDRYGLPLELKCLPIIESALIAHAQSETGESGLWQLPYKVARQYGLAANDFIDERRDPQLSTEAAAKELSRLYKQYGDWHWVIAAYNCGEGAVNRAIQRAGNRRDYWQASAFLPIEAQAYVPLFISAVYIANYYQQHSITKYDAPFLYYATDTIRVKRGINLKKTAANIDMNLNELVYLNPAIIRDSVPPSQRGYPINLPLSKLAPFEAYINNLDPNRDIILDRTKEKQIGIPENNVWNGNHDEFGNILSQKATAAKKNKDNTPRNILQEYTVRKGDVLGTIAEKFDCTVEDIKRWNKMQNNKVTINDVLHIYITEAQAGLGNSDVTIDKTEPTTTENIVGISLLDPPKEKTYKVKTGDTIWSIAQKFGIEPEKLKKHNGIKDSQPLTIGSTLKIP